MIERRTAVFLVNLIQDLSILRPLMVMAHRDFGFEVLLLVSTKFRSRDLFGIWEAELELLCRETQARLVIFRSDLDAWRELEGRTGVIFSASESSVPEHQASHSLLRYAPATFLKVTLQHGFECVGFRHSAAHDRSYGPTVSFEADIVCAWQPPQVQHSLAPSQQPKIEVTGPTAVLQRFETPVRRDPSAPGLVCENLHSVRLRTAAGLTDTFLTSFEEFCGLMEKDGERVALRPHPGGQYVLKNKVELPSNVEVNNAPMYRVDLRRFAYGISAPSSVLIDMLLADIPTAIWRDPAGSVDTSNYPGLTTVSSPQEWRAFARSARSNPDRFVSLQRQFLADQEMPLEPADVFARYAKIFQAADRLQVRRGTTGVDRHRLLVIANAYLPTVQVCLERPLKPLVQNGEMALELLTESRLKQIESRLGSADAVEQWIGEALDWFAPDTIVFSRYSGPHASPIIAWARRNRVPIIYQIDDDLLSVPRSLGERKHAYHNSPERLGTVRELLGTADLVYTSTDVLRQRLQGYLPGLAAIAGPINASGTVIRKARSGRARVLGYMASADHLPNLEMILPAIVDLLNKHQDLSFELFGSIPVPPALARFGERVRSVEPIADYEQFLEALGERAWDIGICPLVATDFNRTKSNNKWVEYTSLGIAVVASAGMIYEECCADGCGLLASGLDDWRSALDSLVDNDAERLAMVERAQRKLESRYKIADHRRQILEMLSVARERAQSERVKEDA
jgi:glycosyltransferase involved in cell wall biosynthesis